MPLHLDRRSKAEIRRNYFPGYFAMKVLVNRCGSGKDLTKPASLASYWISIGQRGLG